MMSTTDMPEEPRPRPTPSRILEPRIEEDFSLPGDFPLDAGGVLERPTLRFALYGQPFRGDNAVLVCHALSGSARVGDWWPALFEPSGLLDPHRDCILGINILGSCYGSTGPSSVRPSTGLPYQAEFPLVSIGDIVRVQGILLDALGIPRVRLALGASIGGMQVLEWCLQHPARIERAIAIGAAPLNAFGLAMNHMQREAIRLDPAWRDGAYPPEDPPLAGLSLARQLATCTYKSPVLLDERFARRLNRAGDEP
jgi:homoserine O-acetyltransferase